MPRQKLSREELLSRVQEIVEYMNTHDGDLPAQNTQLGKTLNNLRTNAKKDAFEQNYPGLIDEIHNISHKILMTSDRSNFFDRVRDMPTGGDFADQTNTKASCILPTCPTLAMNLVTGCFCASHAYKNLLESDMFEHDEEMDQLLGYDPDGKFVVIDKNKRGHWQMPFFAAIHPSVPEHKIPGRREQWDAVRKRNAESKAREAQARAQSREHSRTLDHASKEFLNEVSEAAKAFLATVGKDTLVNASKGARRTTGSNLYHQTLLNDEELSWLLRYHRCPPFFKITYTPSKVGVGGNFIYDNDTDEYIEVENGAGTHERRGCAIKRDDFREGGLLHGRLDTCFVADGDEQLALDGELRVHQDWVDLLNRLFRNIGGGARIGHKINEHSVGLVALRVLDLFFGKNPILAFNSQLSSGRKALIQNALKNYNGARLTEELQVDPINDMYQAYMAYKTERWKQKKAGGMENVSVTVIPVCLFYLQTSNTVIIYTISTCSLGIRRCS